VSRVVFLLVPGFHLLDLSGPAQVFGSLADLGHDYQLSYLAEQPTVPSAQGLPVCASTDWLTLDKADLLIVPGWRSRGRADAKPLSRNASDWLRTHYASGGTVASVCAGAFALAQAGLLDGRRCTTHHELQQGLAERFPRARVVRDVLYVVDGRIITSAGIASGIDLALHLAATRHGPGTAARVARSMVVYARRNGGEQQESAMLRYRGHLVEPVHLIQSEIDARFAERLPLAELAHAASVSERTATRLFVQATGLTPLRYQTILRVERAEHLLGHGATMTAAARAVGFEDARMLRRLRNRPVQESSVVDTFSDSTSYGPSSVVR
jgi:transcriptional regulator GlxA family with amidase domain